MRATRVILLAIVVLVLGAGVVFALAWRSELEPIPDGTEQEFSQQSIDRGAQLAAVGNCIACHTVPGEKSFAGGLALPTPFGTIHSTNITPDPETGIGTWRRRPSVAPCAKASTARAGISIRPFHTTISPASPTRTIARSTHI